MRRDPWSLKKRGTLDPGETPLENRVPLQRDSMPRRVNLAESIYDVLLTLYHIRFRACYRQVLLKRIFPHFYHRICDLPSQPDRIDRSKTGQFLESG